MALKHRHRGDWPMANGEEQNFRNVEIVWQSNLPKAEISNATFHSPNSYCCCTLVLSHERNPSHSSHSRTNSRSASLAARLAQFLARTFCRGGLLAVRPRAIQAAPAAGANADGHGGGFRRAAAHRIFD